MSNFYLPDDLLIIILVRLPTKSLGRFKSVSKSWNALISDPTFVKLHLNQSNKDKKHSILHYGDSYDQRGTPVVNEINAIEYSITEKSSELGCKIQRLWKDQQLDTRIKTRILGSCNGLLCLLRLDLLSRYEYGVISLCNPITNSSLDVPFHSSGYDDHHKKKKKKYDDDDMKGRRIDFYGFGHDDVHDNYKVMIGSKKIYVEGNEYVFEVYSLRSNSWSKETTYLDFGNDFYQGREHSSLGALANCALHWVFCCNNHDRTSKISILAFDLRTDTHRFLPLPDYLEKYRYGPTLGVLNDGCLVFITSLRDNLDMWVMKNYGKKDSWKNITIRNIQESGYAYTPVTLFEDNKRKLIVHNNTEGAVLLLYDFVTHQKLKRTFIPVRRSSFYHPFVASLVNPSHV